MIHSMVPARLFSIYTLSWRNFQSLSAPSSCQPTLPCIFIFCPPPSSPFPYLDFNKLGAADGHEVCILLHLSGVPALDQCQAVNGTLALFRERLQAAHKARPKVWEQGSINLLETVFGTGIHADVELTDGVQSADLVRELGIGDEEGRDAARVQQIHKLVDLRIPMFIEVEKQTDRQRVSE